NPRLKCSKFPICVIRYEILFYCLASSIEELNHQIHESHERARMETVLLDKHEMSSAKSVVFWTGLTRLTGLCMHQLRPRHAIPFRLTNYKQHQPQAECRSFSNPVNP